MVARDVKGRTLAREIGNCLSRHNIITQSKYLMPCGALRDLKQAGKQASSAATLHTARCKYRISHWGTGDVEDSFAHGRLIFQENKAEAAEEETPRGSDGSRVEQHLRFDLPARFKFCRRHTKERRARHTEPTESRPVQQPANPNSIPSHAPLRAARLIKPAATTHFNHDEHHHQSGYIPLMMMIHGTSGRIPRYGGK